MSVYSCSVPFIVITVNINEYNTINIGAYIESETEASDQIYQ